jgi:predicted dienelactone hydrolase
MFKEKYVERTMNLNITKLFCTGLVLLTSFGSPQVIASDAMELRTKEVDFVNQNANRPAKIKFWYQGGAEPCEATICLSPKQSSHRVAIISHGAFGSPREMNWLGYALASQGWVVAGVAHFGESWVYGAENIDPSSAMRFWQRPQDVSFAIDSLSKEGLFNTSLKTDNVIMLGHSSGGFTSLAMAGANLEAGKSEAYCASEKAKDDKGCNYGQQSKHKPMTEEMLTKIGLLQERMRDERVVAVISLDPALGHAVSEKSLEGIKVPALVIGSLKNDFLPYSTHSKYYANHIQGADLVGIEQGAGHFVYIDKCDSDREVKGVFLCKDREGVDRKAIQEQILEHVFGFIYKNGFS